jgi:hypothetical protein
MEYSPSKLLIYLNKKQIISELLKITINIMCNAIAAEFLESESSREYK